MVTNSGFDYKEAMIRMISNIENPIFLQKIYSFVVVFYKKELGAN